MIKSILTEENCERIESTEGIALETALHMFHETGRNKEKLNEAIESFFEDYEEQVDKIEENIEYLKKEVTALKDLKRSLFQNLVKEEIED